MPNMRELDIAATHVRKALGILDTIESTYLQEYNVIEELENAIVEIKEIKTDISENWM